MSVSRRCDFFKATDGQWYMILGDYEYASEDSECTTYGPFRSRETAEAYRRAEHSNPGGCCIDDEGDEPVPEDPVDPRKGSLNPDRFDW